MRWLAPSSPASLLWRAMRSIIAVVSTWSPMSSSHCVISLFVVKTMLARSYASETKPRSLFAWSFLMGAWPISSMITSWARLR